MATPPYSIATTTPADTDIVSVFPSTERTYRDTVWSWLNQLASATTGNLKASAFPPFVNSWMIQPVNATTNGVLTYQNFAGVNRVIAQWDYTNDKYTVIAYQANGTTVNTQLDIIGGAGTAAVNVVTGALQVAGVGVVLPSYSGAIAGLTGVGALASGSLASGFGNISIGSSTITAGNATLQAISGTTGTFSSSISTTALTASTGNIVATAGNIQATAGSLITGGNVVATVSANTLMLRPNGVGSTTGQFQIASNGNVTAAGDITANSDRRLKTSISPLNHQWANDMVAEVQPMTFIWKRKGHERGIGFIAQDVAGYAPELVHSDDHGILSLAYPNMVAILWSVVQDLQKKVAALEAR